MVPVELQELLHVSGRIDIRGERTVRLTYVSEIKNPVSLARLVLDHSTQLLSLRRVPPNLLVGQGATNFAMEHGMNPIPHADLISPVAKQRWRKWRSDMIKAERREQRDEAERFGIPSSPHLRGLAQSVVSHDKSELERKMHEDHMYREALAYGAQTASPPRSDHLDANSVVTPARSNSDYSTKNAADTGNTTPDRHPDEASDPEPLSRINSLRAMVNHPFVNSTQVSPPRSSISLPKLASDAMDDDGQAQEESDTTMEDFYENYIRSSPPQHNRAPPPGPGSREASMLDGNGSSSSTINTASSVRFDSSTGTYYVTPELSLPTLPTGDSPHSSSNSFPRNASPPPPHEDDIITDTVGAIAIDMFGNIACAASSGGIGMKHRGRVGPAALVSIGAAVIPCDDDDPEGKTVATVASGTGEHMTTTMAAALCSERIYQSQRKLRGQYESCMEEEAIAGFIKTDFMDHPSVKQSQSTGAIGTLSVKKTKDGIHFLFGHNTDSFALASMHSDEDRPVLTMSRSNGHGSVAQGGRYVRYRRGSGRK